MPGDEGDFQNQTSGDDNTRVPTPAKGGVEKAFDTARAIGRAAINFLPQTKIKWAIIAGAALILIALAAAAFLAIGVATGGDPRSTGSSSSQPLSNTDLIRKVLALEGDKEAIRQYIIENTPDLIGELNEIKESVSAFPQDKQNHPALQNLLKEIENSQTLINQLPNDTNSQTVNELRQNLQKIVNLSLASFVNNLATQELAETVLNHPKIKGRGNERKGFKHDVGNLLLDRKITELMLALANEGGFDVYICASRTDHSEFIRGTGNRSDHFFGMAIDICKINGQAVRGSSDKTGQLMQWIMDNQASLKERGLFPRQVIGPKEFNRWNINGKKLGGGYRTSTLKSHADHVHIGLYK